MQSLMVSSLLYSQLARDALAAKEQQLALMQSVAQIDARELAEAEKQAKEIALQAQAALVRQQEQVSADYQDSLGMCPSMEMVVGSCPMYKGRNNRTCALVENLSELRAPAYCYSLRRYAWGVLEWVWPCLQISRPCRMSTVA